MTHRALGICCLLTAWTTGASEQPFMILRLDGAIAAKPESATQFRDVWDRYPACFDAIGCDSPDKPDFDILRKNGISLIKASERDTSDFPFYDDHAPRGMIGRALLFAAGPSHTAASVNGGRHCASGKSAYGVCAESMLALAYGAKAISYDLLGYAHEPMSWYANTYMSELTLWRPFFQAYVRYNAETQPGGVLPYCGKNGKPDLGGTLRAANALAPAGLPLCPGSSWPVCYLLNADAVESMTSVDVQRVLSGGVILDGGAVAKLQARGFAAAMQVTATPRPPDAAEVFTDDELNMGRVGYVWQPAAAAADTFALHPSNETARVLGRYQRPDGTTAEAASVLFETPQGGRIAAFGFDGFGAELSAARRRQLLLAADWVAQNRLPVLVETVSQAAVIPRVTMAGDLRSVTVLNASLDAQPPVTLRLRGFREGLETTEWITSKERPVTLAVRWENKDALVTLPAIGPWQLGWLCPAE